MPLTFEPEAPPLRVDESGTVRVGKTRVLLVMVIQAYQQGETPEGIIDMYDTLDLADVHAVIAYYLRHKAEVEEYIANYDREAAELGKKIEARQGSSAGMRERLLKRLEAQRAEVLPSAE
jgi:uncharacterized protein (DUF433 family)